MNNPPVIILIQPQLSWNIGASARSMLNFGLQELRLVTPKQDWQNKKAVGTAAGAEQILKNTRVYKTTANAIADLQTVYATSARSRDMVKPVITPREAAVELNESIMHEQRVGIVFGREKCGLKNDDLSLVEKVIKIPLNPNFSSMNLAHSVSIISYEWYQTVHEIPTSHTTMSNRMPATKSEIFNFFARLEKDLDNSGFLKIPGKREIMIRNIRNLFLRANLTEQEIRTLHGVVTSLRDYPKNAVSN
jgi:tRNA/rRNA methyltransferase